MNKWKLVQKWQIFIHFESKLNSHCNARDERIPCITLALCYITIALSYITLACLSYVTLACLSADKENNKLISVESNAISFALTDIKYAYSAQLPFRIHTCICMRITHREHAQRTSERHRSASADKFINSVFQKKRL